LAAGRKSLSSESWNTTDNNEGIEEKRFANILCHHEKDAHKRPASLEAIQPDNASDPFLQFRKSRGTTHARKRHYLSRRRQRRNGEMTYLRFLQDRKLVELRAELLEYVFRFIHLVSLRVYL
jgi:hypothetical protein